MPHLQIGTAAAKQEQITTGWFDAMPLPTGGMERIPVIIAQGQEDGPVMWITTGIHGPEHTGLITIHRLITPELVKDLRGTLVAIPALNPAGLRTGSRAPYYPPDDPNRVFPDPYRKGMKDNHVKRSGLEEAYARLMDAIAASAPVCLIDLHNAWIGSIPFTFRDPVFFHSGRHRSRGMSRFEAQTLLARTNEAIDAFGFTVINEFVADDYVSKGLHRSVSGSVLNGLGVPSFTVELGSWMHIDPHIVDAAGAGLRNVMRWAEILGGEMEPITHIPVVDPGYPVRRHMAPHMPQAGIVHHLVRPGEMISEAQPLVQVRDIFGQPVGEHDGLLRSYHDGFVLGWKHGVIHYQGEPVMTLAIRDDNDLVVPYPDKTPGNG